MTDDRSRTMQAILRTAMIWAAAWAVAGGAIMAVLSLLNPAPEVGSLAGRAGAALLAAVGWGVRFGLAGAVIGSLFSGVIRLGYQGRRLADIDPVRFGLLGAVVGGVGVPLYLEAMNVLTGGHLIALNLVTDDAVWATVFGAAVAAGSILLARRAEVLPAGADRQQIGHGHDLSAPAVGGGAATGQIVDSRPPRSTYR